MTRPLSHFTGLLTVALFGAAALQSVNLGQATLGAVLGAVAVVRALVLVRAAIDRRAPPGAPPSGPSDRDGH